MRFDSTDHQVIVNPLRMKVMSVAVDSALLQLALVRFRALGMNELLTSRFGSE
jgi:hypothetical protein